MLKIKIHRLVDFKLKHEDLYRKVIDVAGVVINSEELRQLVINFHFQDYYRKYFIKHSILSAKFHDTKDTNEEVYRKFMSGFDDEGGVDHEIDVVAHAYYSDDGVLGSAYVGPHAPNRVKWNTKFFGPIPSMVKTFVHEYAHRIGYGHSRFNTAKRKYSVPYKLGHFAENLALAHQSGIQLTPVQENETYKKIGFMLNDKVTKIVA